MENLTERVYECTLGVEAHMICDLLARAGISARVDGEFLQGAGGDLPLGSSIKVRVAPEKAVEARAVIDEWEKLQPADPTPPLRRPAWRSPLWFVVGLVVGGAGIAYGLRTPVSSEGVDYDSDGDYEITYHYAGSYPRLTEVDRNDDGKVDVRWEFDASGLEKAFAADDDFDGRFEWQATMLRSEQHTARVDRNGDAVIDEIWYFEDGVASRTDMFDESGQRLVSRQHYTHGIRSSAEFDRDGDGVFEQLVEFDRFGLPK
jgi:hypothetical protein